jgi:hypothetical protein
MLTLVSFVAAALVALMTPVFQSVSPAFQSAQMNNSPGFILLTGQNFGYTVGMPFTGDPIFEYGYGRHPFHIFSDHPAVATVVMNPTVQGTATMTVTPLSAGTAHFIISDIYGQKSAMNVEVFNP